MPVNFPEMWLDRVIQTLDDSANGSFLEGVPELNVDVSQINEGSMSEMNKIYVPATDFEVDILVNNTTYPIPFQEYDDETIEITLDKYQTKVVTLRDDQTLGASYGIIDTATSGTTRSMMADKYKRAIHSIAPAQNSITTPVLVTSGDNDGTGRKILTYKDLVRYKTACDNAKVDKQNRRLVLCNDHWNDLLNDRERFGNQLVNYAEGKPAVKIAGFELRQYDVMPLYTGAGVKKPYGSVKAAGDQEGSALFVTTRIAKKTGLTKQYFIAAADNPTRQSNDLSYRHYFIATPFQNKHIGALISGTV